MNRLMNAAKKMKRIVLTQRHLFGTVALFMSVMITFLVFWSTLDAPQRRGEYTLTEDVTEDGETIVMVGYYCSSDSDIWRYIAVLWHCLLLVFATVLAVQTRNLQKGFSESSVLAVIIYSHFVFVMLRVITFLLGGILLESQVAGFRSLIYSTDAIVTMCVYFIPKLLMDDKKFYALTHEPVNQRAGLMAKGATGGSGGLVVPPNRGSGSGGKNNPAFSADSESESEESGDKVKPMKAAKSPLARRATATTHRGISTTKKSKATEDVVGSRASWAGINFTRAIRTSNKSSNRSGAESEESKETEKESEPFERPVDVLKGANSWGGAHVTMLINSENDEASLGGCEIGNLGAIEEMSEVSRVHPRRHSRGGLGASCKSHLSASSWPKEAPPRFDYACSRITNMRHRHHPENYIDPTEFNTESYDDENIEPAPMEP